MLNIGYRQSDSSIQRCTSTIILLVALCPGGTSARAIEIPFERSNTDAQKRKDRDSKSEGKRKRSSLEKKEKNATFIEALFGPGGRERLVPSYSRQVLDRRSRSRADAAHGHRRRYTLVLKPSFLGVLSP